MEVRQRNVGLFTALKHSIFGALHAGNYTNIKKLFIMLQL